MKLGSIMQCSFYVLSYLNCNRDDTYCWPACPCWHSEHSPGWAAYRWRGEPRQWLCRSCGPRRCPRPARLWRSPSPCVQPWVWLYSACQNACLADASSAVWAGLGPGPPPGPGPGTAGSSVSPSPDGTWIPSPRSHRALWGSRFKTERREIIHWNTITCFQRQPERTDLNFCWICIY